jgi:flagellar basal body rod protein FlgG
VSDRSALTKLGNSQFLANPKDITARGATGSIHQYQTEDSAADEIKTMLQMTSAGRDVESNASMIQQHDRMMDRAINGLGRVA